MMSLYDDGNWQDAPDVPEVTRCPRRGLRRITKD